VESRFAPRDSIEVEGVHYHVFRESFNSFNEVDIDTVIYQKTWSFSILADIEDTDNDSHEKGINEIRIESNVVRTQNKIIFEEGAERPKYVYNRPQSSEKAIDADKTLHRNFAFDDNKFWFLKKK